MRRSIVPLLLGLTLFASTAHAVCGDVTGEGDVSTSDALAVLRTAVGQSQDLQCDCNPPGGTCSENGNNDGCEGWDELTACEACCNDSGDCASACSAANAISCEFDALNETCAEQINEAGCGSVCCPGE